MFQDSEIEAATYGYVLELKQILDFSMLTVYTEMLEQVSNTSFIVLMLSMLTFSKREHHLHRINEKRRWKWNIQIFFHGFECFTVTKPQDESKKENRSPCLTPLEHKKKKKKMRAPIDQNRDSAKFEDFKNLIS